MLVCGSLWSGQSMHKTATKLAEFGDYPVNMGFSCKLRTQEILSRAVAWLYKRHSRLCHVVCVWHRLVAYLRACKLIRHYSISKGSEILMMLIESPFLIWGGKMKNNLRCFYYQATLTGLTAIRHGQIFNINRVTFQVKYFIALPSHSQPLFLLACYSTSRAQTNNKIHRCGAPGRNFLTMDWSVITWSAVHISAITVALYLCGVGVEQSKARATSWEDLWRWSA